MDGDWLGVLVALGGGLLIGLERERRKGSGPAREAAGMRSFTLAAMGGALAQVLQQPLLVAAGALMVLVLVGVAYWHSRRRDGDPGLTTELALFITYLVGVLSVQQPAWGAGAAVIVAGLLFSRERLHHFATRAMSDAELHDALLLAALALVVLPLLPAQPMAWLGGLAPRTLALLIVLILGLQGAGHVALCLFGPRAGLALSGLFSGFVSSTATVASLGSRSRADPSLRPACEAGAMFSTASTWIQAMLLLSALSPVLMARLLPAAAAGVAVAAAGGWLVLRRQVSPSQAAATAPASATRGPLRVREALLVAALLTAVTAGVGWARGEFGDAGVLVGVAVSALADAHASIAAVGAMHASQELATPVALLAVLLGVGTNSLTRSVTAFVAGGAHYGAALSLSMLASTGAAAAVALLAA